MMIFKKKKFQFHFIAIFALFIYMTMIFFFTVNQVLNKSQQWKKVLNSSLTVELPLGADLEDSKKIVRGVNGVKVVNSMAEEQKKEILDKWLDGIDISRLPIADILEVKVSEDEDLEEVQSKIANSIDGAKVYSNIDWGRDIFEMAQAIFFMCIFLFSLVVIVSVVLINFMVKSLLSFYSKEIDILCLNGASDIFISSMLQKNIFVQVLKASFLGIVLAHLTEYILSLFFKIDYQFVLSNARDSILIVFIVALIASMFVKFNVEKELRI